ncbi:MAG: class I SAM-dependent methyltransferase [Syntrophobacteraceae bacterium]|jgi:SAM-dependent methyltransferase|nr:class I SAM-dependent methyltransferase [Syntrophobacteraceae bacterium]
MRCIVCGNLERFHRYLGATRRHPSYWRCGDCNLVFAHPIPDITYDHYPFSPLDPAEVESRFANYEFRYRGFEPWLPRSGAHLLDVGAYTGLFLHFLSSKGIHAVGIEPCADAAAYGRQHFGVEILPVAYEHYEPDRTFDAVTMFNVFEHVRDPLWVLERTRSLLSPGGLFVMEIPYIHHRLCKWSSGLWHHFEMWHNWFYDPFSIEMFLDKNGFSIHRRTFPTKVVTVARIFDALLTLSGVYSKISPSQYHKVRNTSLYKVINSKQIKLNFLDYMLLVSTKN